LPEAVDQLIPVAAVTDDRMELGDDLVTDKGYHRKQKLVEFRMFGVRA
jgi:hypothetical protein